MKTFIPTICAFVLLAGCQIMPDPNDTTVPRLTFGIHYQGTKLNSPSVQMMTNTVERAGRCVYVNSPFLVAVNASDPGGVRSIVIGVSSYPYDSLRARDEPGDILALPAPASSPRPYPNPGRDPETSNRVSVVFSTEDAYLGATLFSIYDFAPGHTRAGLFAYARNFASTGWVSELYDFYVEKATAHPAEQPGMPCPRVPY